MEFLNWRLGIWIVYFNLLHSLNSYLYVTIKLIKINKDKENNLYKNSIVKTDHIYKLNKNDVLKKVGRIDSDMIKLFESKYEEYSNEKSFAR